ncbi:MAG: D-alanine--D-alanine ligase, partial [Eudoraea sp.]|nr:D-alanine--D-alanine ligase [Eudoraea sp.]
HILKEKWVGLDDTGKEFPVNRHDFSVDFGQGPVTFDCVFNAIHGSPGEDGYMQAYFALLGIPQTSCSYYQAALTFNKRDLLSVLKPYGVKCARSYHLNLGDAVDVEAIVSKVGLPCFVKANKAGSSFGISKVYKPEDIKAAVKNAFQEDDEILIEAALEGREVSVGVIRYEGQVKVLPITEIIPETDFFDYEAKYQGKSKEITPARISAEMAKKVTDVAAFVYRVLKMKGYARSEFIFVGDEPYMLEMNTTPGLTEESLLPQQAQAAGISLRRLFESAVEEALSQNNYF